MTDEHIDITPEQIDFARRDLPVEHVTSADGTSIAYERTGSGPPVVIVGGGLNEKAMHADLADLLSRDFTVYNYDRRARGDSDDRLVGPYTVQREIEDLAAVIEAAGGPCHLYANCSGAMIAIPAAAQGLPIARMGMYEPPYASPQPPPEYLETLKQMLAEERITDAVDYFLKAALFSDSELVYLKDHPIWPAFEAMAHSMPYDATLSTNGVKIPVEELARVPVPAMVLGGKQSPGWMLDNCRALATGMPQGRFHLMEKAGHLMDDREGAEVLADFFRE